MLYLYFVASIWLGYFFGYMGIAQDHVWLTMPIIALWIVLPKEFFAMRAGMMLGFFFGATYGIPESLVIYNEVSKDEAIYVYLLQSIVLALPYLLLSKFRSGILWASLLLLISPIGWTNPLIIAGALFPDTGFLGLIALASIILVRNYYYVGAVLFASLVMNLAYIEPVNDADLVIGNTEYGVPVKEIDDLAQRSAYALRLPAIKNTKVLLPETHFLASDMLDMTAEVLRLRTLKYGNSYIAGVFDVDANENKLLVVKNGSVRYLPVQASAVVFDWEKKENIGPKWHLTSAPASDDKDLLVVCFEEYHFGVFLWKMIQNPNSNRYIAFENLWWSNEMTNSMVTVQRLYGRLSARLFGMAYVPVFNY